MLLVKLTMFPERDGEKSVHKKISKNSTKSLRYVSKINNKKVQNTLNRTQKGK